jgi:hypothetical protein
VEAVGWPAARFNGGRRRLAEGRREGAMRGNKWALELHQDLGNLPEQLADDEHGQGG